MLHYVFKDGESECKNIFIDPEDSKIQENNSTFHIATIPVLQGQW